MKKLIIYKTLFISLLFVIISACNTDDLQNLNIPKVGVDDSKLNRGYLFANAQLELSNRQNNQDLNIYGGYVKYFATYSIIMQGDRYLYEQGPNDELWISYTGEIKYLVQLMALLTETEEKAAANVNKISQTRILLAYAFHRITDAYGDVPYSEASEAAFTGNFFPKYDTQQAIYTDLLKELDEAAAALTAGKDAFASEDFLYSGDIAKWKKFAYSLMFRLAMRVSKADQGMAQTYITKAVNGGMMEGILDAAGIGHAEGPQEKNQNPRARAVIDRDPEKYRKLGEDLVNWLIDQNDPRLMVYSGGVLDESITGFTSSDMNIFWYQEGIWKLDPADQRGHPHGQTITSLEQDYGIGTYEGMQHAFSRPNPKMIAYDKPHILLNYSEVQLLMAEAALAGWVSGDAATYYEAGVRAAMQQYVLQDASLVVPTADIDAFLAAHPFDPANGVKMISEQYWLATFNDDQEAWSHWRRTGFPEFTPNVDADIPIRNQYPDTEITKNATNLAEAISRLSNGDTFYSPVWWDK